MRKSIVLFRNDLRMHDNPLINHCIQNKCEILPLYVIDNENAIGSASKWWLHESLESLDRSLNNNLLVVPGKTTQVLEELINKYSINEIVFSKRYEKNEIAKDREIEKLSNKHEVKVFIYNSSLLLDPVDHLKKDGNPYKVYTPFYKQRYSGLSFECHSYDVNELKFLKIVQSSSSEILNDLLLPENHWYKKLYESWTPGEDGAHDRLSVFLESGLQNYSEGRNRPDLPHTSMLSPHLRFGEISPRQIVKSLGQINTINHETFYKELVWREFSYHLLYHFPHVTHSNLQTKFDNLKWENNKNHLKSWQKGLTGYPIIDAGMRQLWQTGYMHNRVRMIVGSFLVKNLLTHWKYGQEWFWDTLVDADIANNSASWQWVAGTGADAAPYFRIFNPVTQSKKFDPDGKYIRKYVPELKNIPNKYIHLPSELDQQSLMECGVKLGSDYPYPIVDLSITRERALSAFKKLSKSTS